MKKMKKTAVLLAMLMTAATVYMPASAVEVSLKPEDRDMTVISGTSQVAEGEKITVSIFKQGHSYQTMTGFGESAYDILPYVTVTKAKTGGAWSIEWENPKAGYYDIYASDGMGIADQTEMAAFIASGMEGKYATLSEGTQKELEELMSDEANLISFLGTEKAEMITDGKKIGTALFSVRESVPQTDDMDGLLEIAFQLVRLKETPTAEALNAVLQSWEAKGMVPERKTEYDSMTYAEIQSHMAEKLQDTYKIKFSEFDLAFGQQMILSGVYQSLNYQDAIPFLDLTGSKGYEADKEAKAKQVAGKEYDSLTELIAVLNQTSGGVSHVGGGGGGGFGGGGSGLGSSSQATPVKPIEPELPKQEGPDIKAFFDVDADHWAYEAINYLRWKEVVSGDEKGNFNPDCFITRAEVVKMLCGVFGLEPVENGVLGFEDVTAEHWAAVYIGAAKAQELVTGDENGLFHPDDRITRQDLTVLIYRFAMKYGREFAEAPITFADADQIAEYAIEAVGAMTESGMIQGAGGNRFLPEERATRAETATMLYRLMKAE